MPTRARVASRALLKSSGEQRMRALGYNTYRYRLGAFLIAGAIAGIAGALFACIDGFVTPELASWRESGLAIMMVVLGGTGTLYGAIIGAFAYSVLEEILKSASTVGPFVAAHWRFGMGVALVAAVLADLRAAPGCELARMSGSGGSCFGVFGSSRAADAAARALRAARPGWWICATKLG